MEHVVETARDLAHCFSAAVQRTPPALLVAIVLSTLFGMLVLSYTLLFILAPIPRPPFAAEKTYRTIVGPRGEVSPERPLKCWLDQHHRQQLDAPQPAVASPKDGAASQAIEPAEIFMSVVVPAFNEEQRLGEMLKEAAEYLQQEYGPPPKQSTANGSTRTKHPSPSPSTTAKPQGWEILLVSDGSTDRTIDIALEFAQLHGIHDDPAHRSIRTIRLAQNRGKGGAVTHGLRHVRGQYAIFADADGASKFADLGKLLRACQRIEDAHGRGVAVGSRSHLVGSAAVVRRSFLRNFLMHSFHVLLRVLTPPATAAIKDTQCGFKLFSRAALPAIVPHMHSEGWIFDVEMLMLAEAAGIPVAEVAVGWREVGGSKLNVVWDSLGMAAGLAVLRAAWGLGIYRQGRGGR
ncbi:MAG: dolichyl-phosphate beta-glucosyltransferase [Trizodia sp. TS-e1964]|nr:MAG: dolichyl-phosphate beta-glucosyltransferase [Trizodia sp. TS-e1964]